jgi:amino acid transporter
MSDTDQRPTARAAKEGLRPDVLSLWHVSSMSLGYMGLALATFFVLPFMVVLVPNTPWVFVLVVLVVLPSAISFAEMSRRRPSAGGAYVWLWEAISPPVGLWAGFLLFSLYSASIVAGPLPGAVTFDALLDYLGISTSYWTALIGMLLFIGAVFIMSYRDIKLSTRWIAGLLGIEVGFVLLLTVVIIVKQASAGLLTFTPLNPFATNPGGFSALKTAIIFGLFSICGFDIVATVSEETKTPRRLIPKAIILTAVGAGVFWMISSYGLTISEPQTKMAEFVASPTQSGAVYLVAADYIGALKILVIFTGASAVIANMVALFLAAPRVLYALAREKHLPSWFGELHPKYQTPHHGTIAVAGMSAVLAIGVSLFQDRNVLQAYGWMGFVFVFFVLTVYGLVNVANIAYHWRHARSEFNWVTNGIVPALGITINAYVLYDAFFKPLLGAPFKSASSLYFCASWVLLGLIWAFRTWGRRRRAHPDAAMQAGSLEF